LGNIHTLGFGGEGWIDYVDRGQRRCDERLGLWVSKSPPEAVQLSRGEFQPLTRSRELYVVLQASAWVLCPQ
jgi:hypothetical protein